MKNVEKKVKKVGERLTHLRFFLVLLIDRKENYGNIGLYRGFDLPGAFRGGG